MKQNMCRNRRVKGQGSHLHHAADDLGEHVEGEPENVEQRERHKGLLRIQDVLLIHRHIHGKCC